MIMINWTPGTDLRIVSQIFPADRDKNFILYRRFYKENKLSGFPGFRKTRNIANLSLIFLDASSDVNRGICTFFRKPDVQIDWEVQVRDDFSKIFKKSPKYSISITYESTVFRVTSPSHPKKRPFFLFALLWLPMGLNSPIESIFLFYVLGLSLRDFTGFYHIVLMYEDFILLRNT